MKKSSTDRVLVEFSKPDLTNIVTVSRVLPDHSTEPIGKVSPDLSNGEDSLIYISTNNLGEEICPASSDFTLIERHFERYAKELSEKSKNENLKIKAEELINKERSIRSIRQWKFKNLETNQINR